ncbi:hypothetical protein HDC93_007544 [Streptomyces sp. AK010]|nr:hypothetical protein [Streptomyces sp. AK010]
MSPLLGFLHGLQGDFKGRGCHRGEEGVGDLAFHAGAGELLADLAAVVGLEAVAFVLGPELAALAALVVHGHDGAAASAPDHSGQQRRPVAHRSHAGRRHTGATAAADGPRAQVTALARAYLAFAERHPAVYDALFQLDGGLAYAQEDTPEPLKDAFAALLECLSEVAGDGVRPELFTETFLGVPARTGHPDPSGTAPAGGHRAQDGAAGGPARHALTHRPGWHTAGVLGPRCLPAASLPVTRAHTAQPQIAGPVPPTGHPARKLRCSLITTRYAP